METQRTTPPEESMIKMVAFDVYGTLISSKLYRSPKHKEPQFKLIEKASEVLAELRARRISAVTCSDDRLEDLEKTFREVGLNWLDYFDDMFRMEPGRPKDFSDILETSGNNASQLLVVGNDYKVDVLPARMQGCQALWVPETKKDRRQNPQGRCYTLVDVLNLL